jgi:hypothetical protein
MRYGLAGAGLMAQRLRLFPPGAGYGRASGTVRGTQA